MTKVDEVEAIVNDRSLTSLSDCPDDLQPLSPAQLLTQKTTVVMPPPCVFQKDNIYMRQRWRHVQYLANLFWTRWKREYLTTLQERQKWCNTKRVVQVGDIVLVKDENAPRSRWIMGRVVVTDEDKRGLVRSVTIKTPVSDLRRPIHKLVLLLAKEEQ